jgi:hypothetical protein
VKRQAGLVNCADVRAETLLGFVVAVGTDRGETVLYDAATLRCVG